LQKLFTTHGRWVIGLIVLLLACAQAAEIIPSNTIERLDIFFYDLRVRVQPPKLDPRIVIVDIDEKSLVEVGRWPWSRNIIADLVTHMTEHYQIRAAGFDVQFSEPDLSSGYTTLEGLAKTELKDVPSFESKLQELKPRLDYDERFADALKGKPIVLGYFISEKQKKGMLPAPGFTAADLGGRFLRANTALGYEANIPILQQAARAGGFFNAELDPDGILRSSPLIQQIGDDYYESLGLATARVALGATSMRPIFVKHTSSSYGVLESLVLNSEPNAKRIPVEDKMVVQIDFAAKAGRAAEDFVMSLRLMCCTIGYRSRIWRSASCWWAPLHQG